MFVFASGALFWSCGEMVWRLPPMILERCLVNSGINQAGFLIPGVGNLDVILARRYFRIYVNFRD